MNIKYPLLMIDTDDNIRRLEPVSHDSKCRITRLTCPLTGTHCNYACAFIGLWEDEKETHLPGLICKAFHGAIPLGYLDAETLNIDKYNTLRNGSDISDRLKSEIGD